MRFNTVLPAAALAASATAKTVKVDVGEDGLSFSPEVITAAKGDVLEFTFYPPKHSVVLGDVNKPCEPATEGLFFSGFMTSSSGAAVRFSFPVSSLLPLPSCTDGSFAGPRRARRGEGEKKEREQVYANFVV